jgi:hypothetical protein
MHVGQADVVRQARVAAVADQHRMSHDVKSDLMRRDHPRLPSREPVERTEDVIGLGLVAQVAGVLDDRELGVVPRAPLQRRAAAGLQSAVRMR